MKRRNGSDIKGVIGAMSREIAAAEKKAIAQAEAFAKEKKNEMRKKAKNDNAQLFAMEKNNIDREMRHGEENIREAYLLSIVQAKEAYVEKAWEKAKRRFLQMPKRREYAKFLKNILASASDIGEYAVYMRKEDVRLHKGAKTRKMAGGAIFLSRDGRIERDLSLEGIAKRKEAASKSKIGEVLFG